MVEVGECKGLIVKYKIYNKARYTYIQHSHLFKGLYCEFMLKIIMMTELNKYKYEYYNLTIYPCYQK
jgi:hypothetical protein